MKPDRHELLAQLLLLPPSERVALAHALLQSAASKSGEAGPAGEVAEPVSTYDAGHRAHQRVAQGSSKGLWEAITAFRAETDLESLAAEDAFANLRDRSPGREVVL